MKCCFWKDKDMTEKQETEKVFKDLATHAQIPFLEREKPITDLNSLCDRIKELNRCIDHCQEDLNWAEDKLKDDNLINVSGGVWNLLTEEETKAINGVIRYRLEVYAAHQKELIHTCQDELDWLEMKVGMGPGVGKNMFETGSFNFDPHKNHC